MSDKCGINVSSKNVIIIIKIKHPPHDYMTHNEVFRRNIITRNISITSPGITGIPYFIFISLDRVNNF